MKDTLETYRWETARLILTGLVSNWGKGIGGPSERLPGMAVELTDALISKLELENKTR